MPPSGVLGDAMLNISEGAEVLLKTGEVITVGSAYSSWRGQRWTGRGRHHGRDVEREFGDDDVRAVLADGNGSVRRGASLSSNTPTLF